MRILLCAFAFLPAAVLAADHHKEGEKGKLTGSWESGDWTITFMKDHMVPVHQPSGMAAAIVAYRLEDESVLVIDDVEGNDLACPSGEARYSFDMGDDGKVGFEAIFDPCTGRMNSVTAMRWSRVEMPEELRGD
jgi:hypothetical protein